MILRQNLKQPTQCIIWRRKKKLIALILLASTAPNDSLCNAVMKTDMNFLFRIHKLQTLQDQSVENIQQIRNRNKKIIHHNNCYDVLTSSEIAPPKRKQSCHSVNKMPLQTITASVTKAGKTLKQPANRLLQIPAPGEE